MLYGGPLGTYLSGYYGPGSSSSSSTSTPSSYTSTGTGPGGLIRSRGSRYRTPSAYNVGSTASSLAPTSTRSSFYTPQTRRKYPEETAKDSSVLGKPRYTNSSVGPSGTFRHTRTTIAPSPPSSSNSSSASSSAKFVDIPDRASSTDRTDYKALYEAEKTDTNQLRSSIARAQKQLDDLKNQIEIIRNVHYPVNPENRRLERHLSECEEEAKRLEALRAESEKLKAEHRALTRVVSHLM